MTSPIHYLAQLISVSKCKTRPRKSTTPLVENNQNDDDDTECYLKPPWALTQQVTSLLSNICIWYKKEKKKGEIKPSQIPTISSH